MVDQLQLEIITPQREELSIQTGWVTLPGSEGEMGILPEHIPLMTTLESGILQYEQGGTVSRIAVHYGYAQVHGNKVTVLSEMAELGQSIDGGRARSAEKKAREELDRLSKEGESSRMKKFQAKLERAIVRQRIV